MVLYEDNHLLVVSKKPGILVQGDRTGDDTIIDFYRSYIKKKYNKPGQVFLHPVHRLDRPVSGCLILGRTSKALSRMTTAFREGKVQKTYLALSAVSPPETKARLEGYLAKNTAKNISRIVKSSTKGAKKASLDYELMSSYRGTYLFKIAPKTGRSHQIRVQLAHMGCPILGDVKYKGAKVKNPGMIYLHCFRMKFLHPTLKEEIIVQCEPKDGELWDQYEFAGLKAK